MKQIDVTALGELLIDFTDNGRSESGNLLFEANPGGAPCNVLAMLAKLNKKTAFIGKVGADMFGTLLENAVKSVGISAKGLVKDKNVSTTLAFVQTLKGGEREFSFVRNPGADMMLNANEVNEFLIQNSKIFHFGTLSSTDEPAKSATRHAIEIAEKSGALLSFDPNLRERLWHSLEDAKAEIAYGFSKCNILKISDNEIEFMFGHIDYEKAAEHLLKTYPNIKLMFITLGGDGSLAFLQNKKAFEPVFPVTPVEKTGAGDTFFGCALWYVLEHGTELSESDLHALLKFANAGAALITLKKGALKAMPAMDEIQSLLKSNNA